MPEIDASVVITAFTEERWNDLCAAISSVQKQSRSPREIVVVSDHNSPLAERLRREISGVRVVDNFDARGVTGSRNIAVQATAGEVVAFLDDDAEADPDWLMHLLAPYADPAVIGVGGALEPRWMAGKPSWFPDEFNWVIGCTYRGMATRRGTVRNFIGANMSFRREVFDRVKFNTAIGHVGHRTIGGSDPEFCIRVGRTWPDRLLLHEPLAVVHHRAHAARGRWGYFLSRCYSEGLSKALVRRLLGTKVLTSEGRYTVRTLPAGVVRGLRDSIGGDLSGLGRAGAIVVGLVFTTTGFVVGSFSQRTSLAGG